MSPRVSWWFSCREEMYCCNYMPITVRKGLDSLILSVDHWRHKASEYQKAMPLAFFDPYTPHKENHIRFFMTYLVTALVTFFKNIWVYTDQYNSRGERATNLLRLTAFDDLRNWDTQIYENICSSLLTNCVNDRICQKKYTWIYHHSDRNCNWIFLNISNLLLLHSVLKSYTGDKIPYRFVERAAKS